MVFTNIEKEEMKQMKIIMNKIGKMIVLNAHLIE